MSDVRGWHFIEEDLARDDDAFFERWAAAAIAGLERRLQVEAAMDDADRRAGRESAS